MNAPITDSDQQLKRATGQIQVGQPSEEQIQQAASRVWTQLSDNLTQGAVQAAEVGQINGCEDYQKLIPAYLAGNLTQARKLLLEDHTRECVPCRRAMNLAREGEVAPITQNSNRTSSSGRVQRLAMAAMMILGLGAAAFLAWNLLPFGLADSATVKTVDGQLFRVASTSHVPLADGDIVRRGETVRTGRDGGAIIELNDGSMVELRARSEISIRESRSGTTVDLERGNVIIQAAKQRQRHLYVATDDCLVSVTGTIFSVNHGTKGSRVSVIEGEVRVQHSGDETILQPGQQIATQTNLDTVPVKDEIAWSRDVDRYLELLSELSILRRELDAVPRPNLRYSSSLLDLMPQNTHFFAAIPNLGESVDSAHQVIRQRLAESQLLGEWWLRHGHNLEPVIEEAVSKVSRFSEYLGSEIAVGGGLQEQDLSGPLVLAEIVDAEGLRQFIEEQIDEAQWFEGDLGLIFLDDPLQPAPNSRGLFVWLGDEVMAASPQPALIEQVAKVVLEGQSNPFVGSDFHRRIAELYSEGAGILAAADLESIIEHSRIEVEGDTKEQIAQLERLGLLDVRHLMVEHKNTGLTENRAVLTFNETRHGIASWIAAPAPMGSLAFISAEAKVVGAMVFKDPVRMLDDLEEILGEHAGPFEQHLEEVEDRFGLSLREDFAAVLGGEMAFAFDGPLLPDPAWKAILEVYDSSRFQWAVEQTLAQINEQLAEDGQEPLVIHREEVGGRTYYNLPISNSALPISTEIHYTFVEGYLVAAPSRALIDRAIRFRDSGYSIEQAPRFTALLPSDGRNNYSALFYQDLGGIMQAMAERIGQGQLSAEQQQILDNLQAESTSTLGYAYAEDDRIIVAATNEGGVLGSLLMQLAGAQNPAGLAALFENSGP